MSISSGQYRRNSTFNETFESRFLENIPTASFKEISDAVAQHRKQS